MVISSSGVVALSWLRVHRSVSPAVNPVLAFARRGSPAGEDVAPGFQFRLHSWVTLGKWGVKQVPRLSHLILGGTQISWHLIWELLSGPVMTAHIRAGRSVFTSEMQGLQRDPPELRFVCYGCVGTTWRGNAVVLNTCFMTAAAPFADLGESKNGEAFPAAGGSWVDTSVLGPDVCSGERRTSSHPSFG